MSTENRDMVAKAHAFVLGEDPPERTASNAAPNATETAFTLASALAPPYDPLDLVRMYEASAALQPNIEAYKQNIEANGWHLEPVLNLDGDDAHDIVRAAMRLERLDAIDRGHIVTNANPTDAEVEDRIEVTRAAMELERYRIEAFFEACSIEESFTSLRKKTRQDLETTGNGYWEALRDARGRVVQFVYLQTHTMRLRAQDTTLVDVRVPVRMSPISVQHDTFKRRFRSFVQVTDVGTTVFFKELGDPRLMSASTGRYYETMQAFTETEPKAVLATEVMHYRIHSSRTAYGIPRWIGTTPSVMGSREADEVNLLYFENKSVPPLAVVVSGGRLTAESVAKMQDYVTNEIKGKGNFHKILIVEGEPTENTSGENNGKMKIEFKPLTSAQQTDGLFLKYDERNHDKIGFSFRLPRIVRGDVRDFNRATADAAIEFAEAQVFGPERMEFDYAINREVLSTMGVRFYRFVSNAVQIRDPKTMAGIIAQLTEAGALVPADARALAEELVLNRKLTHIEADWLYQPTMLTQVGVPLDSRRDGEIPQPTGTGPTPPTGPTPASMGYGNGTAAKRVLGANARSLLKLRDELEDAERREAREAFGKAEDKEPEVIRMSLAEARTKFGVVPS